MSRFQHLLHNISFRWCAIFRNHFTCQGRSKWTQSLWVRANSKYSNTQFTDRIPKLQQTKHKWEETEREGRRGGGHGNSTSTGHSISRSCSLFSHVDVTKPGALNPGRRQQGAPWSPSGYQLPARSWSCCGKIDSNKTSERNPSVCNQSLILMQLRQFLPD